MSIQHFGLARDLGMETVGFLMMAHKTTPAELARQARIMVDAGAQCVYCVDSAGALVLGDAQERIQAMYAEIGHQAELGFHGHQNLSLGVANSVLAYQHGARQIDGALCALGAGAGNSPTEVLAATFDHLGVNTGVDVGGVLAAAEEVDPAVPAALAEDGPGSSTAAGRLCSIRPPWRQAEQLPGGVDGRPGVLHGTRTAISPARRAPATFAGMSSRNTIRPTGRPSSSAALLNASGSGFMTPVRLASMMTSNSFRCSWRSTQSGPWKSVMSLVSAPSASPAALVSAIRSTISARSQSCSGSSYILSIMARVSHVSPTAAPSSAARCAQYCRSVICRRSICCHSSSCSHPIPPIRSSTGRIAGSRSASRPARWIPVACTVPRYRAAARAARQ